MRVSILAVFFFLSGTAAAGEKTKPNTLTPKESADGWILLFDGETTFGWNVHGDVTAQGGSLVLGGKAKSRTSVTTPFSAFEIVWETRGDEQFIDCIRSPFGIDPDLYNNGARDGYRNGPDWLARRVRHEWKDGDTWTTTHHKKKDAPWEQVSHGRSIGGRPHPLSWFTFEVPAGDRVELRNVKLRPLGQQPLFNGKDLTGWRVFAGEKYKSKFSVEDGAITVKDGPGDLQTDAKYDDFLLQLECKSNGKHLNSGIFFRCRPGEYQNGYEAQIRNQFTPEPTQDYTIDKHDPKTHELLGKDKIKSTAVDFGTGAVYRRVPARKESAKDGEWFTLTILAHGNRFATWVNGVQQVDWTDHRAPSDNARTGYRQAAGHISIQGHDPTTDLSFRNLRIAELPKAR